MALFNNLADVLISTSKTILDVLYNKLGIRVASRVAERLKPYIKKISNLGGDAA